MKKYDVIIVGGGISGIYTMYNLKKNYPNLKVLLLEKNERFGGRVYTHHEKVDNVDYTMDLGAGRIGYHHKLMVNLIKELKLEKYMHPISNTENYIEYNSKTKISLIKSNIKQKYSKLLYNFFNSKKILQLKQGFLESLTLKELLLQFFNNKDYNNIENSFEYKQKLYHFNAYNAINYFKEDYNSYSEFFIMTNGLSSIIKSMISIISQNKKYKVKKNSEVTNIVYDNNNRDYILTYKKKCFINKKNFNINVKTKYLICALPRCDLIKFKILNKYNNDLNSINEISKLRIFEIYEKNKNNGEVWFENISKTVTNEKLQFIIPINPETGLIMSSYNENLSTQQNYYYELYKKNKSNMKEILRKNLSKIFNTIVPESKYIKLAYWKSGVACWKKNVHSHYISHRILNLMPNFYICGENYSNYQAWCEGALQTSLQVIQKLDNVLKQKNSNKTKKYKNIRVKSSKI